MAGVLETLTVPRASAALPSASLAPLAGSSFSTTRVRFADFKGLKIQSSSLSSSSSSSSSSRIGRRRGNGIVCEAQSDTAFVVPAVKDDEWQKLVLESDKPVLVEFWAPWCGPCRMIHPIIDELAKEFSGKLQCYKVNTDDAPGIATNYGIRSIPTVMIFKGGEKKDAIIGAVGKAVLTTCIEKFLQ